MTTLHRGSVDEGDVDNDISSNDPDESLFVGDSSDDGDLIEHQQEQGPDIHRPVATVPRKSDQKRRVVTGSARPPTSTYRKYTTEYYAPYDHANPQQIQPFTAKFTSFSNYDHYVLFSKSTINHPNEIPSAGVRIDDLTISRVIGRMSAVNLHRNWPADLDHCGMVRATRMPLGKAAKMNVEVGDIDIDGNVIEEGNEGFCYKWWRGLHCLMGKEGFDAGMYLIRPSFEQFRCEGFTFKKGFKAVLQVAEDQ